jgi:prepilin-type N-terminal cleavage/methylation domain-containing protein
MKMPKRKRSAGFALIELLIVLLLVSIFSAILVKMFNARGFSAKANDAARISRLQTVKSSLELFFTAQGTYPLSEDGWVRIADLNELHTYLSDPPEDSVRVGDSPCDVSNVGGLYYRSSSGGSAYVVATVMEISTSNDSSECTSLSGWNNAWCDFYPLPTEDHCYAQQSPGGYIVHRPLIDPTPLTPIEPPEPPVVPSTSIEVDVLSFSGYVDNDRVERTIWETTFNVPANASTYASLQGLAEEGHPWPPYNCTPGPDIDPDTGSSLPYCDQNQPQESFSVYVNDVLCYSYADQSPLDDQLFPFSSRCYGVIEGINTFRIVHDGDLGNWQTRSSISFDGGLTVEVTE